MVLEMKRQYIELDDPVPSLQLSKLKFENGNWKYIYCIETPTPLTNKRRKRPLYFSGSLKTLELSNEIPPNMINVEVYCIEDVYELFRIQRESDLAFREKFIKSHKEELENYKLHTFIVDNKNQDALGKFIVQPQKIMEDKTIFVGRS